MCFSLFSLFIKLPLSRLAQANQSKMLALTFVAQVNLASNMTHAKALAVVMALHARLGKDSALRCLPTEILRKILHSFEYCYCVPQRRTGKYLCGIRTQEARFANSSPSLSWLLQFFRLRDMQMPTVYCHPRGKVELGGMRIAGRKHLRTDSKQRLRQAFVGHPAFATMMQSKTNVYRHSALLHNFQRFQDLYWELFACPRRFSVEFKASDPDYNFMLFEPAFKSYTEMRVSYATVDGKQRAHCHVLQECTVDHVRQWLRDLWGPHNFDTYVRVRDMECGLQIFIFGPEIDPDDIVHAECFQKFRRKFGTRDLLCI